MKVVFVSPFLTPGGACRGTPFLEGVAGELRKRGNEVTVLAPSAERAPAAELDDANLVLVTEGSGPELVRQISSHKAGHGGYILLFHDTRHHACTAPEEIAAYDLSGFDGVLAGGEVIRQAYLERDWAAQAWTWHEAADTRLFRLLDEGLAEADLIWAGDWGDSARRLELREFLLQPARQLRLRGTLYGSGCPWHWRARSRLSGLHHRGPVPVERLPTLFARHRVTVDVPYEALPGVPSSRLFEALACGIPLITSPWDDFEGLFEAERDYLLARDHAEMREALQAVIEIPEFAAELSARGLATIRSRHTCAHRVDDLLAIAELGRAEAIEVAM